MSTDQSVQRNQTLIGELASLHAWRELERSALLPEKSDPQEIIIVSDLVCADQSELIHGVASEFLSTSVAGIVRSSLTRAGRSATSAREIAVDTIEKGPRGNGYRDDVRNAYDHLRASVESLLIATQILDSISTAQIPEIQPSAWVKDREAKYRPQETLPSVRWNKSEGLESGLPQLPAHVQPITESRSSAQPQEESVKAPTITFRETDPTSAGVTRPNRLAKVTQRAGDVRLERQMIVASHREQRRRDTRLSNPRPGPVRPNLDLLLGIFLVLVVVVGLLLLIVI